MLTLRLRHWFDLCERLVVGCAATTLPIHTVAIEQRITREKLSDFKILVSVWLLLKASKWKLFKLFSLTFINSSNNSFKIDKVFADW